jgi:hypothetical protein
MYMAAREGDRTSPSRAAGVQRGEAVVPYQQRARAFTFAVPGAAAILCCGGFLWMGMPAWKAPPVPSKTDTLIAASTPDGPVPAAIHTTVRRGSVAVALTISPIDVGVSRFVAVVQVAGRRLTAQHLRLRLSMPSQPLFGVATLTALPCAAGYCSQGQLPALGRWHVAVRVCGQGGATGCTGIPFDFMNGANARFLFAQPPDRRYGPATVTLSQLPQHTSDLRVHLRSGLSVRAVMAMPNMLSMGTASYRAQPRPGGWYHVWLVFSMPGVTQLTFQVQEARGWRTVRTLFYDVGSAGTATLLTNTPG